MRERVEDFPDTLWVGVLAIALLVLAAVAAESAPITAFDQEKDLPIYLRSRGYGKVLGGGRRQGQRLSGDREQPAAADYGKDRGEPAKTVLGSQAALDQGRDNVLERALKLLAEDDRLSSQLTHGRRPGV